VTLNPVRGHSRSSDPTRVDPPPSIFIDVPWAYLAPFRKYPRVFYYTLTTIWVSAQGLKNWNDQMVKKIRYV